MGKNITQEILFPFLTEGYRIDCCKFKRYYHNNLSVPPTNKLHHHVFYEVHFVKQGQMVYQVKGQQVPLQAGEFLVLSPDTSHRRVGSTEDAVTYHLTFALAGNAYQKQAEGWKKEKASQLIKDAFYHTARLLRDNPAVFRMEVSIQVLRLISLLSLNAVQTEAGLTKLDDVDNRVLTAKAFIAANVRKNITCKQVAEHCYLSGKQLSRLFIRYEGINLKAYIDKKRSQEAARLVADRRYSLMQISEMMNFCNEYYFNRFFKKHAGMCPGEYRNGQM